MNGVYQAVLDNPFDNYARLLYADHLEENGRTDFGCYIRDTIAGKDTLNTLAIWCPSYINDMCPPDAQPFLLWEDGLPSVLDYSHSNRHVIFFSSDVEGYGYHRYGDIEPYFTRLRLNTRHVKKHLVEYVSLFPIREIKMGWCSIFPHAKIMIVPGHLLNYGCAGFSLVGLFNKLDLAFRLRDGVLTRENLFSGHGNMRLAQYACSITVRGGRGTDRYRRFMVDTVQGYDSALAGCDELEVHRIQQCIRSFSVE